MVRILGVCSTVIKVTIHLGLAWQRRPRGIREKGAGGGCELFPLCNRKEGKSPGCPSMATCCLLLF